MARYYRNQELKLNPKTDRKYKSLESKPNLLARICIYSSFWFVVITALYCMTHHQDMLAAISLMTGLLIAILNNEIRWKRATDKSAQ